MNRTPRGIYKREAEIEQAILVTLADYAEQIVNLEETKIPYIDLT